MRSEDFVLFPNTKRKKNKELKDDNDPNCTCEICPHRLHSNTKFKNGNRCSRPFCSNCITKYIEAKVGEIAWSDLFCNILLLVVNKCYSPQKDRSALILNECGGPVRKSTCPNCKNVFCFHGSVPWHQGYQCNESAELRDKDDIPSGKLIEDKKWTRCTQCGQSVERFRGCFIINCRCRTLFCHNCGNEIQSHYCGCTKMLRVWWTWVI
ncbi:hypothetical protein NMG60_11026293 [Bertholletia excelsa]